MGFSVQRRILWLLHRCREMLPALQSHPTATIRPWVNHCNFLLPLLLGSGLSPQHKLGVSLLHPLVLCSSSCTVYSHGQFLFQTSFFWVISEDVEVRWGHDPKGRIFGERLETIHGWF